MKKLSEIIKLLEEKALLVNTDITDDKDIEKITYNSKEVENKTLFFVKGRAFKQAYLDEAMKNGGACYIAEKEDPHNKNYIIVNDIRMAMLEVARFFYDYPDQKIKLIGITGTKGKSTTVTLVKTIFDEYLIANNKKPCGIISSINTYDGINSYDSSLTTPESLILYQNIYNAVRSGLEYMVIEISSQALKYHRVTNLNLDLAAILNIGVDHISPIEHPDFNDYFNSKLKIINLANTCIYNFDSEYQASIIEKIKAQHKKAISFSLVDNTKDYFACNINYQNNYNHFDCIHNHKSTSYQLNLIGDYNIENALVAIAIADYYHIDHQNIFKALKKVEVAGRSNIFKTNDEKVIAIVDYAHNRLSFERVFELIKNNFSNYHKIVIFGVVGGKALNRIDDICPLVATEADFIHIVPVDPADVPYENIAKQMADKINEYHCPFEIHNQREAAIKKAFSSIEDKTLILVAGKGNEKYQHIGAEYIKIRSDLEVTIDEINNYNLKH